MALLKRLRLFRLLLTVQFGLALYAPPSVAQVEAIYRNVTTFSGDHVRFIREYGDEIHFAGTARTLVDFTVEFRATFAAGGDEAMHVRLYQNDGVSGAPGTLIYSSGWFPLGSFQGITRLIVSKVPLSLPDTVTCTVEFRGFTMEAGDDAGMLYYNPPTVGTSDDFLWMRNEQGEFQRVRWNAQWKNNLGLVFNATKSPSAPMLFIRKEGESIIITSQTQLGFKYHLERKSAIESPNWERVQTLAGTDGFVQYAAIPIHSGSAGLFRVVVE